jgi:hypothetical protein
MLFGWLVFASFGMLLPRYFKLVWSDVKWCGKPVWFQLHQPCMVLALLLTAAGFIIIFCEAEDYVRPPKPSQAHSPLGIIVMILILINPIMAIFRCDPKARWRPIFNVCHFIVGLLAHLSAVVTIFLGLYMKQLDLPLWPKGVMAGYMILHFVVEIVLAIHMHWKRKYRSRSRNFDVIQMDDINRAEKFEQPAGSVFESIILTLHACGVIICAVAISIKIGMS